MAFIVWGNLWRLRGLFFSSDLLNLIFIFLLGLFIWHTDGRDLSFLVFWLDWGFFVFSGCSSLSLYVSIALYHTIRPVVVSVKPRSRHISILHDPFSIFHFRIRCPDPFE